MDTTGTQNHQTPVAEPLHRRWRTLVLILTILSTAWLLAAVGFFPPAGQKKGDMMRLLGRLHPLVVHLPVVLLPLALLFEAAGLTRRFDYLKRAAGLVIALGALSAVGAAVHGYLLAAADGFEVTSLLKWHMWTGTAVAILAMICWTIRVHAPGRWWAGAIYFLLLAGVVGTMSVAAHFGGSLTHGEDYLTEFLPPTVRARLGIQLHKKSGNPAAASSETRPSAPPTVYSTLIAPALEKHCVQCHGPAKVKGGLRLDSFEGIVKGGKVGHVVIPKDSARSDIYRRITLQSDDEDYMPPDGKAPLPADVVKVIGWWIQDGASADRTIVDLKSAPAEIQDAASRLISGK